MWRFASPVPLCEPGTVASALGSATCQKCDPGSFSDKMGTVSCTACPTGKTSAAGSVSRDGCTDIVVSSSQTSVVVFDVVLPYSREAFTEAVQSNFRIGMAAAAKAGCQCEVTKSEVIITIIQATAAAPGTRRHLSAAAGVTVGVSILMPNLQAGNLLVQSGALSKEGINKELDKLQVERVTSVSSPALSSSASNGNNNTSSGSFSGGQPVGSVLDPTIIGVVVTVVVLIGMAVVVLLFCHNKNNKVVAASEEPDHDYEELKKKLESACSALGLSFSTRDDGSDFRSASRPNSASSQRRSAPHDQSTSKFSIPQLVFGHAKIASEGLMSLLCVDEAQVYGELSRGLDALDEEMEKHGTDEDKVCYQYVRHQEAGSLKKGWQHGWQCDCDRDTVKLLPERQIDPAAPGGKRGMRLDDFANHATAKKCRLTKPEVLALRFYTTAGFRSINNPLRDMDRLGRHEAHPLPIMVWLLSSAVKKLRTAFAEDARVNSNFDLYRGMGNV